MVIPLIARVRLLESLDWLVNRLPGGMLDGLLELVDHFARFYVARMVDRFGCSVGCSVARLMWILFSHIDEKW